MSYPKPDTLLRHWEQAVAEDPKISVEQFARNNVIPLHACLSRLDSARRAREIKGQMEWSLGQPLKLEGDWMIVGDVHVPFTDYDFAHLVGLVARKHLKKPRRLLIAGDFFNMDVFSAYPHLVNLPSFADERTAAVGLLDEWLETFNEIVVLMGNHERRLQKFTAAALDEVDIIALCKSNPQRVKASNFGHCVISSNAHDWRVTHPKNYSINQLVVADTLANKYRQNILSFHEHHLSLGWDRFKHYLVVNGGCLVESSKLSYVALDDTKSAGMAKGFVMLREGVPYLFGEAPVTDWNRWV